jgi:hypothetical protein
MAVDLNAIQAQIDKIKAQTAALVPQVAAVTGKPAVTTTPVVTTTPIGTKTATTPSITPITGAGAVSGVSAPTGPRTATLKGVVFKEDPTTGNWYTVDPKVLSDPSFGALALGPIAGTKGYMPAGINTALIQQLESASAGTVTAPVIPPIVTTPATVSPAATTQQQIATVQSQITDLQKQSEALVKYGLSDTNQLTKDASGNYVPKQTTTAPPVTQTPQAQVTAIQTQLTDLQAQQKALSDYGLTDTNQLTKDAYGNYVPKTYAGTTTGIGTTTELGTTAGTTTDVSATLKAIQDMLGVSGTTDYQSQIADLLTKMQTQETEYISALKAQPTAEETYAKYRELLGLPAQEAEYTTAKKGVLQTQQLISDTENLINKLESDINTRIGGMTGVAVTEAQRRRLQAVEQKPLAEQLAQYTQQLGKQTTAAGLEQEDVTTLQSQLQTMLGLAGQTQEQQLAAAKEPLSFTESLLPAIESLAQYQSPQQKLAQTIASEQIQKLLGLGGYATTPTTTTTKPQILGSSEMGYYSYNPDTGETTPILTGTGGGAVGAGVSAGVAGVDAGLEGVSTATAKSIQSDINSAQAQYKLNPSGFREKFIESQVKKYGESARNYITNQVYGLMPDITAAGKPATQAQETVAEYATRIEQAEQTFSSLEKTIQKENPLTFWAEMKSPTSYLQSQTVQSYKQAASNFINAKLRRESGAVIAESEFTEARSQYLPAPGDTDETLKMKKANRKVVFESLKKAAGPAYSSVSELLGETTGGSSYKGYNLPY